MAPTTPQHIHTLFYSPSIFIWEKQLSLSNSECLQNLSQGATSAFLLSSKFHWHVIIRIKRNILPVLIGRPFSSSLVNSLFLPLPQPLHVISATLISVIGSLVLSLHICLSLSTQRPCPGRIPSTGPRCRRGAAGAPMRCSHSPLRTLIETGNLPGCLSGFFIYLNQALASLLFQIGPCYNYLLKQNASHAVNIPYSIYPFFISYNILSL